MMDFTMDILDPAGSTAIDRKALARRPAGLAGAVIGILDNGKPNARVLLERVPQARALEARCAPAQADVVERRLPGVLDEIAATAPSPYASAD